MLTLAQQMSFTAFSKYAAKHVYANEHSGHLVKPQIFPLATNLATITK